MNKRLLTVPIKIRAIVGLLFCVLSPFFLLFILVWHCYKHKCSYEAICEQTSLWQKEVRSGVVTCWKIIVDNEFARKKNEEVLSYWQRQGKYDE